MSVPKREAGSGDKVPEGSLVELGSGQEENAGLGGEMQVGSKS